MVKLSSVNNAEERVCPVCESTFYYKAKTELLTLRTRTRVSVEPDYEYVNGVRCSLIDSPYCLECYYARESLIRENPGAEPTDDDVRRALDNEDDILVIQEEPPGTSPDFQYATTRVNESTKCT